MCRCALGCGFVERRRGGPAPWFCPAIVRDSFERSGVHASPGANADPGTLGATEAGGCLQSGSGPFAHAGRGPSAATVASVGAKAPTLAVAAIVAVAVGGRRPTALLAEAFPPLLAAKIPAEGR